MKSELMVKDKTIVTPGEEIAKGMDFLPSQGTFREGDSIYASLTGLLKVDGSVLKVVPLSGEYIPKMGDVIIGQVSDILMSGWVMNTFSPYSAILGVKEGSASFIPRNADLTKFFDIGEYVSLKVFKVTSQKLIDVTNRGPGLRKLEGGRIIRINANKVPRVIGKQGSMVSMIKERTNTQVVVGQNGVIWLNGDDPLKENLAVRAIKMIEEQAHTSGLTETMEKWLGEQQ